MAQPSKSQKSFKDYYLILQIHPEADYAMVDAAYWHLARRYNQAALADSSARARLDDLNEAYSVLGSPKRRDEYDPLRARLLRNGAQAIGTPVASNGPPLPLAVMERQKPRPRERPAEHKDSRGWARIAVWQLFVIIAVMLTLGAAGFGRWAPPQLVGGLLVAGILAVSVHPLWRLLRLGQRIRLPRRLASKAPLKRFDPGERATPLATLHTTPEPDASGPFDVPATPPQSPFARSG